MGDRCGWGYIARPALVTRLPKDRRSNPPSRADGWQHLPRGQVYTRLACPERDRDVERPGRRRATSSGHTAARRKSQGPPVSIASHTRKGAPTAPSPIILTAALKWAHHVRYRSSEALTSDALCTRFTPRLTSSSCPRHGSVMPTRRSPATGRDLQPPNHARTASTWRWSSGVCQMSSLVRMLEMCVSTVFSVTTTSLAIAALERPEATRPGTSRSRARGDPARDARCLSTVASNSSFENLFGRICCHSFGDRVGSQGHTDRTHWNESEHRPVPGSRRL